MSHSLLSSPSSTHTQEEFWRDYIGGTSLQLFEVIHRAIDLAKIDYPDKFLAERDRIAQTLFTPAPPLNNNNKKNNNSVEEEDDEDGNKSEVVAVSCNSKKAPAATATAEEESSIISEGVVVGADVAEHVAEISSSGQRPPRSIIRIRCKVRTTQANTKQKPLLGKQVTPPPAPAQQQPSTIRTPQPMKKPAAAAAATMPQPTRPRPLLPKPMVNKVADNHDLEKKFDATKRKMRDAYDRADLSKRIKSTQILDLFEVAKLHNNDKKHAMGSRNNNTSTNRGTRRLCRR